MPRGINDSRNGGAGFTTSLSEGVATLRLDRPEKLNALPRGFWPAIREVMTTLEKDGACRAIILTGSGRAFCSGGDIESFEALSDEAERHAFQSDCMASFSAMEQCPLPIIAAVNGLALGGGCELAMASDIVIASESATFGLPEARLGLVPGYGVLRGPRLIGPQRTKMLIMSTKPISAREAELIGLVQQVTANNALDATANELARTIAAHSAQGMRTAKSLVGYATPRALVQSSIEALTALSNSADAEEGRRAFLLGRLPVFNGAPRNGPQKGNA